MKVYTLKLLDLTILYDGTKHASDKLLSIHVKYCREQLPLIRIFFANIVITQSSKYHFLSKWNVPVVLVAQRIFYIRDVISFVTHSSVSVQKRKAYLSFNYYKSLMFALIKKVLWFAFFTNNKSRTNLPVIDIQIHHSHWNWSSSNIKDEWKISGSNPSQT